MVLKNRLVATEVSKCDYKNEMSLFGYSLFVTPEWTASFGDSNKVIYLHFNDRDKTVGKISGIIKEGARSGPYLFFHAGPALIKNELVLYDACMTALYQFARKKHFSRIYIHANDQQYSWQSKAKVYNKRGYLEYIRHFDPSEELPNFSKSVMYNVRKAGKAGATFHEEQSVRILNRFHELLAETQRVRFKKHGANYEPYPYDFLDTEIVNNLFSSGILRLFHVETGGEVHCVRCALDQDKRMFGLMIASDAFTYKNGLNHFMQYHLISKLHNEGYKYYNISGGDYTNNEHGLSEYKESLGCSGNKVFREYTYYITFPYRVLNPLMKIGRNLARNKSLAIIKTMLSRIKRRKPKD